MGNLLKLDPAIEKFNLMRERVQEHAHWTPRMVRIGVIFGIAVPLSVYYICAKYDNVFQLRGNGHGMSVYKYPSLVYKKEIEAAKLKASEE